jgi:hypothetical protein
MLPALNPGRGKDLSGKVEGRIGKTTYPHRKKDGGIKEGKLAAPDGISGEYSSFTSGY